MSAVFEWRSEYKADLVETQGGDLEVVLMLTIANLVIMLLLIITTKVITSHPSASVGLYHHYNVKVIMEHKKEGCHTLVLKLDRMGWVKV